MKREDEQKSLLARIKEGRHSYDKEREGGSRSAGKKREGKGCQREQSPTPMGTPKKREDGAALLLIGSSSFSVDRRNKILN